MTTVTKQQEDGGRPKSKPPRPKRVCFSFATYATNLIDRLKSSNVVVEEGFSDTELSSIESNFNFTFPPDLRAILQQGVPISPGFPNWRSSSAQQLQILLNLPVSSILRRVSNDRFWHPSWGPQPQDTVNAARRLLNDAPTLVPIYRHCYIPSSPIVAGNPVFFVDHDGDVRLLSFDVAGFFREAGFLPRSEEEEEPVWAAKTARRIGFWSEMADGRGGRWWWRGAAKGELSGCLEGVLRRLREGGWREEEIREMMTVVDEEEKEEGKQKQNQNQNGLKDQEAMTWHMRVLSLILLRAGWSREDVVYSLGVVGDQGKSWLEQPTATPQRQHQ